MICDFCLGQCLKRQRLLHFERKSALRMRSIKPQERDEVRHLWNQQTPGGSYGTHSNPRLASQSPPCAKNSNIPFKKQVYAEKMSDTVYKCVSWDG